MPATAFQRGLLLLLLMLSVWGACYRLGAAPLLDEPNEGEYAEVAREMVESGDWVSPRLNYVLFLNKPPLTYWLIGVSFLTFGINEFAARLPEALAAIIIVILLVHLGTSLFDPETGLLAGFVLLTTGGFIVEAHTVRPDLLLTAGIVGSLAAFAQLERTPDGDARWAWIGLQVSLAVGLLAKGMLGVVIPGCVFAVRIVTERRSDLARRLLHPRAWWLLAVLVVPWHLAVGVRYAGFLWDYVVNQHVLFFFDRKLPRDSTPIGLAAFWAALAFRLLPWTLFAPLAVVSAGLRRRHGEGFVLVWAAAVLLLFSLAISRMEHYSIPALPALALLIAKLLRDYARDARFARLVTAHTIGLALLALPGPFVVPRIVAAQTWLAPPHELPAMARWIFGVWAAGAALAAIAAVARKRRWVAPAIMAAFVVGLPAIPRGMAAMARVNSSAGVAAVINASVESDERLVYEAPIEYQSCAGLNFYLGRKLDLLRPAGFVPPPYLEPYMAELFIDRDRLQQLWQAERVFMITDPLQAYASLDGVVPRPRYVVARDRTRWVVTNAPLH